MLGSILDELDLAERIAKALRLAGDLSLGASDQVALAVGLQLGSLATVGTIADLGRRSSVQPISFGSAAISSRFVAAVAAFTSGVEEG